MFFLFLFLLFLLSCGGVEKSTSCPPKWFYEPTYKGKVCGVGVAGPHLRGVYYQRNLALQRAMENLALQKGVKVKSLSIVKAAWTKQTAQVIGQKITAVSTDGSVKITGTVVDYRFCKDTFYVLVCE